MTYYIFKVVITGIIVVIITETAKFNLRLAALITAMPIVTLLCIFWMYYEGIEKKEISEYVFSTLKFLIPTLPMFVLFPIFFICRCQLVLTLSGRIPSTFASTLKVVPLTISLLNVAFTSMVNFSPQFKVQSFDPY